MPEQTNILYPNLDRDYTTAVSGHGSYIQASDGVTYLDACSGAIVANIGHGNIEVLAAMREQLNSLTFCYRTQFTNQPAEDLARELACVSPSGLDHVVFTNSGSEAVETTLRLAIQYWHERGETRRHIFISRDGSYHGATLGALALSGHPARRRPFEAILPTWPRASEANCQQCPFALTPDICNLECARSIENAIDAAGEENVAAVIFEPVVGASAGAVPAPPGYMTAVREICSRRGVLLIADEVITGLGRTGQWFAVDHEQISPDLIALGKGVSAGYSPLGAVLVSNRVYDTIRAGSNQLSLGHTYAANPLSAAAGLAVLRYLVKHDIPAVAEKVGHQLALRIKEMLDSLNLDVEVRGKGLLLALDFTRTFTAGTSPIAAADVVSTAKDLGLLVYPAGTAPVASVVIIAPPLNISPTEVDELLEKLARTLLSVTAEADNDITLTVGASR